MIINGKYVSEINIVDREGGLIASIADEDVINHGSVDVNFVTPIEEVNGAFLIKKYFRRFIKREYEYPKRDRVLIEFDKEFWKGEE